ncbi:MAG: hypothetical protein KME18_12715 [Phormidium tanganyikae FI6-MK23]|jgi:hypothetical protein|nr:hypothetical protein [Phormidium tanganyikae FI6-MK23]
MSKRFIALSSLVTLSALNLAGSLPVLAQARQLEVKSDAVRVLKRAPVQFERFEVQDPETGKPISPDTVLTLPDGKQVKAGEYYAELNRLEQQFSQIGYSFRQPEESVVLQESVIDASELRKQVDSLSNEHRKVSPERSLFKTSLDPTRISDELQRAPDLQIRPGALQNLQLNPRFDLNTLQQKQLRVIKPEFLDKILPAVGSPTKGYSKSWNYNLGNPNTFSAYVNGKLQLQGSKNFSNAYAEGNAGGYIFNNQANLLRATASMSSQKSGNAKVAVRLDVVGQNVYNFQDSRNTLLIKSDSFSRSVDQPIADLRFSLGPIPMRATFGVQGSAGIQYTVAANPAYASAYARVNPFVDSKAYGQGGADIYLAGAGVGANLTLVRDDLDMRGQAYLAGLTTSKPSMVMNFSAYNTIDALSGNAYAYAYMYVPKFGIPPWKKKQWNWNIWSWQGFKTDGYLFDEAYTVPL